jgi:hypothetical protein
MRPIVLACLLAFGCVHIPEGPAGAGLRACRVGAIASAVGGAVLAGSGGGLAAAGVESPSCYGWSCSSAPFAEALIGWAMVGLGALHMLVGGILAAQLIVSAEPPR